MGTDRIGWVAVVATALAVAGCASGDAPDGVREKSVGTPVALPGPAPASPFAAASERARDAATFAVIVGVSRYHDPDIPPLEFAHSDAEAVREKIGCDPARVRLLRDGEATRAAIAGALEWLNRACGPADTAILYFGGHGAVDLSPQGEFLGNYLLPADAQATPHAGGLALDPATGLAIGDLERALAPLRAARLLFVLDACFAGGAGRSLTRARLDAEQAARSKAELEGLKEGGKDRAAAGQRCVLAATSPNEPALEVDALRGGLFTHYFLESLDADGNRDDRVTVAEAFSHLSPLVAAAARTRGHTQTPVLSVAGDFALKVLPRRGLATGFAVRLGPRPAVLLKGVAEPPAEPVSVSAPGHFSVEVDAWRRTAPLYVYLFRVVAMEAGARVERLAPDGENRAAPLRTVAEGRRLTLPDPAETGSPAAPVPEDERSASVLYVLVASEEPIPLAAVARAEARLLAVAEGPGPRALSRRAAAALEGDPALRNAALQPVFVRHEAGQ